MVFCGAVRQKHAARFRGLAVLIAGEYLLSAEIRVAAVCVFKAVRGVRRACVEMLSLARLYR